MASVKLRCVDFAECFDHALQRAQLVRNHRIRVCCPRHLASRLERIRNGEAAHSAPAGTGSMAWDREAISCSVAPFLSREMPMPEWDPYRIKIPKPGSSPSEGVLLETVHHVVHVPAARRILEDGKPRFDITRDNVKDTVTWNPWIEKAKAMGDFAPNDGYKNMVCVEVGAVNGWQKLDKGEVFEGGMLVKSHL